MFTVVGAIPLTTRELVNPERGNPPSGTVAPLVVEKLSEYMSAEAVPAAINASDNIRVLALTVLISPNLALMPY
jgi:hypothetical protein